MSAINDYDKDEPIVNKNERTLRAHLNVVLKSIGVEDSQSYSWHSFRCGGSYLCGLNGVTDSAIKAHGRWRSTAYVRYVSVEMPYAGRKIAQTFNNI